MSLYISQQQCLYTEPMGNEYLPVLFDHHKGSIKHRIYSTYYKYAHIMLDSYEIFNRGLTEIAYPIAPMGSVTLVFFLGHGARGEVWGCNTALTSITIPANTCIYCVRLKPGAIRCFGEYDAGELTDRQYPVEALLPHSRTICQQLRYAESFHERNVMIQRFLDVCHAGDFKEIPKIEQCLQAIHEQHGVIKVNELASLSSCSSRYINRLFLTHIGIAPKLYCQIVQLDGSLHDILQYRPKSLLDIAVRWGYFDQAHMNRMYQKFLNKTAYEMKNVSYHDMSQKEVVFDTEVAKNPSIFGGFFR